MMDSTGGDATAKALRRDAFENRERLIAGAIAAIARHGFRVPVATIAAEAGVGVGTFYRSFVDRDALMRELQLRAYDRLIAILDELAARGESGLTAIEGFLRESFAIADQLILPLHGASPLVDEAAVTRRQGIDARLETFLSQARDAGTVGADVNAIDVIICSALITQPLHYGPDWERSATRHIELFLAGLAAHPALGGPAILQTDIEKTFTAHARSGHRKAP